VLRSKKGRAKERDLGDLFGSFRGGVGKGGDQQNRPKVGVRLVERWEMGTKLSLWYFLGEVEKART